MPAKELSPEEFKELSKHIFDIEQRKGIAELQTNLSEEEISIDVKKIFDDIDTSIHTLEVIPDDGSKPYFIHRDSIERM